LDNFFDNKNNDKVKVVLDEILSFSTIDELKYEIIRRQFSGKYLSELISKLKKQIPSLFDKKEFEKVMEIIGRRNIHLHNKGFVDEIYCKSFNLYSFNVGEYAFIDSNYLFIEVFNTLSTFVTNLYKLI